MSTNHSMTATPAPKPRIAYIDALRGLTMLLVVYSHIQFFGYYTTSDFNLCFVRFRMPLFFFVSGWVLYKESRRWDFTTSKLFIIKKFKVQIISTLIFFSLYIYLFDLNLYNAFDTAKSGYWFTYTLFFYFLFYITSVYITHFKNNPIFEDIVVALIALMVMACNYVAIIDQNPIHQRIYGIIGIPQWKYYIFFCFGVFVKKYFNQFVSATDNAMAMAVIIVSFFILLAFNQFFTDHLPSFYTVSYFLYGFLGITILYTVFRKNEEWFATNQNISRWMQYIGRHTLDIYLLHYFFLPRNLQNISRWMQYIGRHTLDIYLLHYFFLPRNLQMIGSFINNHPNPTIELFFSSTLALMVIGICLLVSKVLCTSPILANVLFGKK